MAKGDFTKAKEISIETKKNVLNRQRNVSIFGTFLTMNTATFHHVLPRSSSGVGYEFNIVALSFDEHRAYHDHQPIKVNGRERYTWEEADTLIKNHLKIKYENWSLDKCKYHKYWNEEDYGITRREKL